jgi:3-oxoacyl-(acyl-carrier-protein) synthase
VRRVVITGVGVISSIGIRLEDVAHALREERSGTGIDPERKERGFRFSLTGIIQGLDARTPSLWLSGAPVARKAAARDRIRIGATGRRVPFFTARPSERRPRLESPARTPSL